MHKEIGYLLTLLVELRKIMLQSCFVLVFTDFYCFKGRKPLQQNSRSIGKLNNNATINADTYNPRIMVGLAF